MKKPDLAIYSFSLDLAHRCAPELRSRCNSAIHNTRFGIPRPFVAPDNSWQQEQWDSKRGHNKLGRRKRNEHNLCTTRSTAPWCWTYAVGKGERDGLPFALSLGPAPPCHFLRDHQWLRAKYSTRKAPKLQPCAFRRGI